MIPYSIIFIFLIYCVYYYDIRKGKAHKSVSYLFVFILMVLMVGLRYKIGGDSQFYDEYYPSMPKLSGILNFIEFENYHLQQPLWIVINALCRSISDDIILFQFFHAILFNIAIFIFINKYSSKPFSVILLLYVSLFYFYFSFEIQRETMAVAVFLLNIKNLENNKYLNYYLLATVSFLFHISAVVLFFLPLFKYVKLNRIYLISMLIGSVLFSVFRNFFYASFDLLLLMDTMKDKAEKYSESEFNLTGMIAFFLIRVIFFLPFAYYVANHKEFENKYKWFFTSFVLISVFAQFFSGTERFLNYLFPLYFVIWIQFIYQFYPRIKSFLFKSIIVLSMTLHVFFTLNYKLFIVNPYGQHYYSLFFPYVSVFNPMIIHEREEFYENVFDVY